LRPEAGEAHLARAQYLFNCISITTTHARNSPLLGATLLTTRRSSCRWASIDRLQGRWNEAARSFEEALELDPGNLFILRRLALNYLFMRRFAEETAILDRALALDPKDSGSRVLRAMVDLDGVPIRSLCMRYVRL